MLLQGKSVTETETATTTASNSNVTPTAPPLDGIVILVTGSTSGIGRSLVRWAFGQAATILAMGRSNTKLEKLRNELAQLQLELELEGAQQQLELLLERQKLAVPKESNDDDDDKEEEEVVSSQLPRFFPIVADMSDLDSVSNAVDFISSSLTPTAIRRIDIVVCNAGMWPSFDDDNNDASNFSTEQGYDLTFGVNYLSHFLLTEKLMHTRIIAADGFDNNNGNNGTNNDEYLLSPISSRIVQVSSSLNMAVDGTDLAVLSKVGNNSMKEDDDHDEMKEENEIEKEGNVEEASRTRIHSPIASRIVSPSSSSSIGSSSDAGFVLNNLLEPWFRGQRRYANSKLAQLLHE